MKSGLPTSNLKKMLKISNLSFSFDRENLLNNINFSAQSGQFVSIIGPNGAGKSTLLKLIANIFMPQNGKIKIASKDIFEYTPKSLAKIMAYIPQFSTHVFRFTVMEYITLGRTPFLPRFSFISGRDLSVINDVMELTEISHVKERYLDEISGGERTMVETARALAQEPSILLADEPTTFLDLRYQLFISSLFKKLTKERNLLLISVYHDLNLASRFSDRMVLLSGGQILAVGTPEEVLQRESLEAAYRCKIFIDKDPTDGTFRIKPY